MNERPKTFYEQEVERLTKEYGLPAHHYAYIRQSKAFMEKYHADKIELNEMAAAACMSRFHYIRIFQQVYGRTPRQFLRDLRIEKAKELLKKGYPVTWVCFDVGYESLPTFSKVFKQGTGHSPKVYQQLHISNPE
ncbi:helix-turn-helix transcriptional regulator [Rhodocytophaga rosea]|uniref:Helix-turn-helix transcriptional regulator n=2 Tax=Rhodocytophaga rosea TaxID=2704465 RepID=A0A6C0GX11_9BACT|nr:helix-turn-helix transcriptional regulator [Rhodocytophaga rosea]